jgi:hypothetical protein
LLHLDSFPTNNLKTDFIRETAGWRELEAWLSKTVAPVVSASRQLAHASFLDTEATEGLRALRQLFDREAKSAAALISSLAPELGTVEFAFGPYLIRHSYSREPSSPALFWTIDETSDGPPSLNVSTNLDHRLTETVGNASIWACWNMAEVVALRTSNRDDFVSAKDSLFRALIANDSLVHELVSSFSGSTVEADNLIEPETAMID